MMKECGYCGYKTETKPCPDYYKTAYVDLCEFCARAFKAGSKGEITRIINWGLNHVLAILRNKEEGK